MSFKLNPEALAALTEDQRAEAEQLLAELEDANKANPLLTYNPHPKQVAFHISHAPLTLFAGGNRGGKSTALILDNIIQACDREVIPKHLLDFKRREPPFYGRIIAADFTRMMEGVIFQKLREWIPKNQLEGGSWLRAYDKTNRVLRFRNGSWLDFLTTEQDIDKFGGAALHQVSFDEEPPGNKGYGIFRESMMRLIDFDGEIRMALTPLFGLSWVHKEVWERRGEEVAEGLWMDARSTVIQCDIDENPFLSQKAKQRTLDELPAAELEARKRGKFIHFAGLIYPEFKPERHVIGAVHEPVGDVIVGIDPGINNTAVLFACFGTDNKLTIFAEDYSHDQDTIPENVAKRIKATCERYGVRPRWYLIDPAARARDKTNAEQVDAAYHRAGIPVKHAQNSVNAGIFEVKRRFEKDLIEISTECVELIRQIGRYRVDPKSEEFKPLKTQDDLVDVARYLSLARPVIRRTKLSSFDVPKRWRPGTAPKWSDTPPEVSPMGDMF